jgi:hypothetical protein
MRAQAADSIPSTQSISFILVNDGIKIKSQFRLLSDKFSGNANAAVRRSRD